MLDKLLAENPELKARLEQYLSQRPSATLGSIEAVGEPALGRPTLGERGALRVLRVIGQVGFQYLSEVVGPIAYRQVAEAGVAYGRQLFQNTAALREAGDVRDLLQRAAAVLYVEGVMAITRVEQRGANEYVVEAAETVSGSGAAVVGSTLCYFEAGVLEGLVSAFTGGSVEVVEEECWGTGATRCRFRVVVY